MQVSLYSRQFEITDSEILFTKLYRKYMSLGVKLGEQLVEYCILSEMKGFVQKAEKKYAEILDAVLDEGVKTLDSMNIYTYDKQRLANVYFKYIGSFESAFRDLCEKYFTIINERDMAERARQYKKDNRGRVVGGGFGIGGAIKGMAIAGAINTATGIFASISNSIDRSITNSYYSNQLRNLLNNRDTIDKLGCSVYFDVVEMVNALGEILNTEHGSIANPYSWEKQNESNILQKRIKNNEIPKDKEADLLIKALRLQPYDDSVYELAYEKFGDDNGNLQIVMKCFDSGFDIASRKEKERKIAEQKRNFESIFGDKVNQVRNILNTIVSDPLLNRISVRI